MVFELTPSLSRHPLPHNRRPAIPTRRWRATVAQTPPNAKTARLFIRGRAASWRQAVQPFACSKNRRGNSLAREWAFERPHGACGVEFIAENGVGRGGIEAPAAFTRRLRWPILCRSSGRGIGNGIFNEIGINALCQN